MLWESYYTSLHFQRESGNYMHQLFLIYKIIYTQVRRREPLSNPQLDAYRRVQPGDWVYVKVFKQMHL